MFPSTTTVNGSLHAYPDQYHLFDHTSPCSRNDIPSPFFHYFSPTIDDGDAFLPHQQDLLSGHFPDHLLMANASPPATAEAATSNTSTVEAKLFSEDVSLMGPRKNNTSSLGRKRGSKKDRHSKIFTRQGPRDRRMRLSLEIARPFFDLQDMLGFDKASKTVDWLMTNSREAIKKLARDLSHTRDLSTKSAVSSTSEGEVVSGMDESATKPDDCSKKAKQMSLKAKRSRPSRKASFNPLSKEFRAIARARARERTKTKKMMNNTRAADEPDQLPNPNNHDHQNQPTTPLSPRTTGDQEAVSQSSTEKKLSSELLAEAEEPPSLSQLDHPSSLHETVDDTFSIFQYDQPINISLGLNSDDLISSLQNNDMMINFLQENWHMDSTRPNSGYCAISNVHSSAGGSGQERLGSSLFKMPMGNRLQPQFIDMQFYAKPWEDYNS